MSTQNWYIHNLWTRIKYAIIFTEFRKTYEASIVASRQPEADKDVEQEGKEKAQELSRKTSRFILRRTQSVLDQYLPKKYETVIFCKPTPLQVSQISYKRWPVKLEIYNLEVNYKNIYENLTNFILFLNYRLKIMPVNCYINTIFWSLTYFLNILSLISYLF